MFLESHPMFPESIGPLYQQRQGPT
jgi:hypothetical protein